MSFRLLLSLAYCACLLAPLVVASARPAHKTRRQLAPSSLSPSSKVSNKTYPALKILWSVNVDDTDVQGFGYYSHQNLSFLGDGPVHVVNVSSGELLFTVETGVSYDSASPQEHMSEEISDRFYAIATNHHILMYNGITQLWSFQYSEQVSYWPQLTFVPPHYIVCTFEPENSLPFITTVLNVHNGSLVRNASNATSTTSFHSLTGENATVSFYRVTNSPDGGQSFGGVGAMDISTGSELWFNPFPDGLYEATLRDSLTILLQVPHPNPGGICEKFLVALHPWTGDMWSNRSFGYDWSPPYAVSDDGNIVCAPLAANATPPNCYQNCKQNVTMMCYDPKSNGTFWRRVIPVEYSSGVSQTLLVPSTSANVKSGLVLLLFYADGPYSVTSTMAFDAYLGELLWNSDSIAQPDVIGEFLYDGRGGVNNPFSYGVYRVATGEQVAARTSSWSVNTTVAESDFVALAGQNRMVGVTNNGGFSPTFLRLYELP